MSNENKWQQLFQSVSNFLEKEMQTFKRYGGSLLLRGGETVSFFRVWPN